VDCSQIEDCNECEISGKGDTVCSECSGKLFADDLTFKCLDCIANDPGAIACTIKEESLISLDCLDSYV
jgi:hypothetical protein